MHKDILTGFASNEAEAFGSVEPLHCPFFHGTDPFPIDTNPLPADTVIYRPRCAKKQKKQPFRYCPWLRFPFESYGLVFWTLSGTAPVLRNASNPTTMYR
jgi:hypothetical protein